MSYLSLSAPSAELDKPQVDNIKARAIDLLKKAIAARGKNPDDFIIRDLLPTDLGASNDEWKVSYASAYTDTTIFNTTLPEDKFIVIFGVANGDANPGTTKLKFWVGTVPARIISLQDVYVEEVPKKYFDPIIWIESQALKIEGYSNRTGDEVLIFKGYVAEPKGKNVSVPPSI